MILHVDMDAFFASVELLHHPEWRGKPLVVGSGPHERGVVSTCSYEARRYGVHSAMPSRTAYALCPSAVFVRPHIELYEAVSAQAFEVFGRFSPYVEKVSIDEAFLDITGTIHLHGDALTLGNSLRREIRKTCGVTCSVGIAANRLMAKIGSELNKPDGITVVPTGEREVAEFLRSRPVSILWGIGRHTEAKLKPYGIATCGDIQRLPVDQLAAVVGSRREAETLRAHAFGISDDSVHWDPAVEKSVSREHTFKEDVTDRRVIRDTMLRLVADVGRRFRESSRWARTARIKLRDSDFNTITRQTPFDAPARDDFAFRAKALELLERERTGAVRLIGFGVTNIQDSPDEPASLFPGEEDVRRGKRERLSEALDVLRNRGIVV